MPPISVSHNLHQLEFMLFSKFSFSRMIFLCFNFCLRCLWRLKRECQSWDHGSVAKQLSSTFKDLASTTALQSVKDYERQEKHKREKKNIKASHGGLRIWGQGPLSLEFFSPSIPFIVLYCTQFFLLQRNTTVGNSQNISTQQRRRRGKRTSPFDFRWRNKTKQSKLANKQNSKQQEAQLHTICPLVVNS